MFDLLSLFGLILGVGAILAGQYLEGGHYSALINEPALLIVVGGIIITVFQVDHIRILVVRIVTQVALIHTVFQLTHITSQAGLIHIVEVHIHTVHPVTHIVSLLIHIL